MDPRTTPFFHAASPAGSIGVAGPHGPEWAAARVAGLEREVEDYKALWAEAYVALIRMRRSPGWLAYHRRLHQRDRLLPPGSGRKKIAYLLFAAAWASARVAWRAARLARRTARLVLPEPVRRAVRPADPYAEWIAKNEPGPAELERQRGRRFPCPVTISLITPTYETPAAFLKDMLRSVREQTYAGWELCVADGGSRSPDVRAILEEAARCEPRIKVRFLPKNEGIAGNTAAALALAAGDYIAFLDHDDLLAPSALYEVARAVNDEPDADVLYSDEDLIDAAGARRMGPHFKPDWSPDLLRSLNYVCHLTAYRRQLLEEVGGPRPGFDGAQDYDLILRASERANKIVHIPKILYHWRAHPGSTALSVGAKDYAHEAGRRALQGHLDRLGLEAAPADGPIPTLFHTTYRLPRRPPLSVIVPTRDQADLLARCLDSVGSSGYGLMEILVVENHSREEKTFAYYRRLEGRPGVRLLRWDRPFNYAAVNNWAARQAAGEVLLFLNNDVEARDSVWLERMLEHALRPDVGAVGAKLLYADDAVQHAGVVVGLGGFAAHVYDRFPRTSLGYYGRLGVIQNYSAVTGACLMMRKDVFEEVGGFDEQFVLAYNDVDLCLAVRRRGYRIVWTPRAELYHHESATRGYEDTPEKQDRFYGEARRFAAKWADVLRQGDPYYNPNLTLDRGDCSLRD